MNEQESDPDATASTDHIKADRACINCGFNLYGQVVTKEPHYGLAIATCPECNTVAALQSYPTMSHWVNRFRALIGGVWIVLLVAGFVVNILLLVEYTRSATATAGEKLSEVIGEEYETWAKSQPNSNYTPRISQAVPNYYQWVLIPADWTEAHLAESVKRAGGYFKNINAGFAFYIIPASIFGLFAGIFWSLALIGSTRKQALLVPLVACLIAAVWLVAEYLVDGQNQDWSRNIVGRLYEPILGPPMIAYQFIVMGISLYFARKLARFVFVITLPPRSRVPFSIFWTRDGLDLPKPKVK